MAAWIPMDVVAKAVVRLVTLDGAGEYEWGLESRVRAEQLDVVVPTLGIAALMWGMGMSGNGLRKFTSITLGLVLAMVATRTFGQPNAAGFSNDPSLFLSAARKLLRWDEPAEPAKIVGPIYFVGTKGLSVFLITSSEGHVVLNTGMPESGPLIEASIRKLRFKPEDVKILLTGHAHCDHVGGHAYLKKLSGAKIAMIREEKELFESGGKTDFHYGTSKEFEFEPAPVDRVFTDGQEITLGDIRLTAILTNGHTKGSTTYVMKVKDGDREYTVVFPNGTSINPGYRLLDNPSYEGIANDFRRTLHILGTLKPDIWLHPHNRDYDFDAKLARSKSEGTAAWVDPEGYKQWLDVQKQKFELTMEREQAAKDQAK